MKKFKETIELKGHGISNDKKPFTYFFKKDMILVLAYTKYSADILFDNYVKFKTKRRYI